MLTAKYMVEFEAIARGTLCTALVKLRVSLLKDHVDPASVEYTR